MVISNEPGFYKPGAYGIRLETLVMIRPGNMPHSDRAFLEFETLTLAPFDRRLIDLTLLGPEDTAVLDAYHAQILDQVGPHLPSDAQKWLKTACAPLKRA